MEERKYTVYTHISPSGKRYIGVTSMSLRYRWNYGKGYIHNKRFYNAILKYGWDNFEHIIVADGLSANDAYEMEKQLIAQFNSNDKRYGYNNSTGGEVGTVGCHYHTVFSEQHKNSLRKAWEKRKQRGLGIPWNKGKRIKDTGVLDNFIKAGRKNGELQRKRVAQLSPDTLEVIETFESVSAAARALGYTYTTSISRALNSKMKLKAHGYFWVLENSLINKERL